MEKQELDLSWFDLKKYEKLKGFDLKQWSDLLFIRYQIKEYKTEFYINKIKENPLYLSMDNLDILYSESSIKSAKISDIFSVFRHNYGLIRSLGEYLDYFIKCFNNPYYEPENENNDLREKYCKLKKDLLNNSFESEIDNNFEVRKHKECYVLVNLTATNEQIKKDFSQWIDDYRKESNYPSVQKKYSKEPLKGFTEKEFTEWRRDRILPYLDLTSIAEYEGKELTQEEIYNFILSDMGYSDIGKKIREIKDKAKWLISKSTLNAMNSQAENG